MNDKQFIRRIRRLGRDRGISVTVNRRRGKGSHSTLYFGDRKTTVKHGEIRKGLLAAMLRQLGLTGQDIE